MADERIELVASMKMDPSVQRVFDAIRDKFSSKSFGNSADASAYIKEMASSIARVREQQTQAERQASAERKQILKSEEAEFIQAIRRENQARAQQHALIKQMLKDETAVNKQKEKEIAANVAQERVARKYLESLERARVKEAAKERIQASKAEETAFIQAINRENKARSQQHALFKQMLKDEAAEYKRYLASLNITPNPKMYSAPIGPVRYGQQGTNPYYIIPPTPPGGGGTPTPSSGGGGPGANIVAGVGNAASAVWASLGKIYAVITAIKVAWYSIQWVTRGLTDLVKMGLDYIDTIKDAQYSIAGLVSSYGTVVDSTGKAVSQNERWNASLYISKKIIDDLIVNSLTKTKAPFDQLLRGLQEGFSPMLAAGIKNVSAFVVRFNQVMSTMRVKPIELGQEIRGLLQGDTSKNSRIAMALYAPWKNLGINVKKMIGELVSKGEFEDWFMKTTESMGKAGELMLGNLGSTVEKFKQKIQYAIGPSTAALYESLIGTLDDLSSSFVQVGKDGKVWINPDFAGNIKMIADAMGTLAEKAAEAVKSFAGTGGFVSTLRDFVSEFTRDPIIVTIKTVVEGALGGTVKDAVKRSFFGGLLDDRNAINLPDLTTKYTKMYAWLTGIKGWSEEHAADFWDLANRTKQQYSHVNMIGHDSRPRSVAWDLPPSIPAVADKYSLAIGPKMKSAAELKEEEKAEKKSKKDAEKHARDLATAAKVLTEATTKMRIELNTTIEAQLSAVTLSDAKGIDVSSHVMNIAEANKKAAEAQAQYNDEIDLLGSKNSIVQNFVATINAMRDAVESNTSAEFLQKFSNQLKDTAQFSESPLWKKYGNGAILWKNTQQERDIKEQAKAYAVELKQAIKTQAIFEDAIGGLIGSLVDGGTKFGEKAAAAFSKLSSEGTAKFMDDLFSKLAGVTATTWTEMDPTTHQNVQVEGYVNKYGNRSTNKQDVVNLGINHGSGKAVAGAISFAQVGLGAYQNGTTNAPGSIVGGAVGGAAAGFSIAGWQGAIVGAIVGGIAAAYGKQEARDKYKFASFRISSGTTYSSTNQNMNAEEVKGWVAEIQTTYETFYNGYVKLMTKIPNAVLPQITNIFSQFQDGPSANFLKHLDEWVHGTLPDVIMQKFHDGLEVAAKNFGMTKAKFEDMFTSFNNLDPQKTLELWTVTFAAMENFQKSMKFYTGVQLGGPAGVGRQRAVGKGGKYNLFESQRPELETEMDRSFAENLKESDKEIYKFSDSIKNLVGEDAIRAAQELSQMAVDRMETEKQFFRDLITLSRAVKEQTQTMVRDWTAEGFKNKDGTPDFMKQAEYWKAYGDDLLHSMSTAKTPQELEKLWAEYTDTISKVKDLQSQLGVNNAEWVRTWAIAAIQKGSDVMEAGIRRLGTSLDEVNNQFVQKVMPVINSFLGTVGTFTTSIGDINDRVNEFHDALDDANHSLINFKQLLDDIYNGGGLPVKGGGDKSASYGKAVVSNRYATK